MGNTEGSTLVARTQTVVFVVLLFTVAGMLAWLSEHYRLSWDWTAAGRNTLTEPSRTLVGCAVLAAGAVVYLPWRRLSSRA